jgi:electron transport complex protein RnfB
MDAESILHSVLILGGVGLFFGLLIALANRTLKVWEDPRIHDLEELLPGTNCGACGTPGCHAFAEGLAQGEQEPVGCTVMGPDDIADVAEYLGVDAGEANRRVARLLCAGGREEAVQNSDYGGVDTCKAASVVAGGGKGCTWGCLGLADCEVSCTFGAIYMNDDALPVVIPELCTACNDCVVSCPKDLFVLMPVTQKLIVQCKNLINGDSAEDLCSAACTACGKCVQDAESGLIEIINGLAVIDYEKNEVAEPVATSRCPTGAIVWLEGAQFQESPSELRMEAI